MKTILLKSNINSGGKIENFAFTGVLRYSFANIEGYFDNCNSEEKFFC